MNRTAQRLIQRAASLAFAVLMCVSTLGAIDHLATHDGQIGQLAQVTAAAQPKA